MIESRLEAGNGGEGATLGRSRSQQTHLADRLYARIPARLRLEGSHSPYKGVEVIPATKLDSIRAAWAAGDRLGALRIAARFFDRSGATKAFKRGMTAHNNPGFYRQLGKDPDLLLRTALELLARKFSL